MSPANPPSAEALAASGGTAEGGGWAVTSAEGSLGLAAMAAAVAPMSPIFMTGGEAQRRFPRWGRAARSLCLEALTQHRCHLIVHPLPVRAHTVLSPLLIHAAQVLYRCAPSRLIPPACAPI